MHGNFYTYRSSRVFKIFISMAIIVAFLLFGLAAANSLTCNEIYKKNGLSSNYNETIAHAIHSMTVQGLRQFNARASAANKIPTVNRDLSSELKVLPYAPDAPLGNDYVTMAMNTIDNILSHVGNEEDGLGRNWSPIERVVHTMHMWDLWQKILPVYHQVEKNPPADDLCSCLLDTSANGVLTAVEWIAHHYESGTPITLLNRPIPKLVDAESWSVWKSRLLYYYKEPALRDAALYLFCSTKGM